MTSIIQPDGTPYKGLPWWTRAVGVVGLPTFLVIILVGFILYEQSSTLRAVNTRTEAQSIQQHTHDAKLDIFLNTHEAGERMNRAILAQICSNGCPAGPERRACIASCNPLPEK
jgi:hypothetical protein